MNQDEVKKLDKTHIWHPCSQMKDYEEYPAINIVEGKGVWLTKSNGEKMLDAISSWWTNIFGHGNEYIRKKISAQLKKLEHVIFANYTHEPAVKLAKNLSGLFFNKLPKIFYTDNGSSSVEVALKMSYHYWYNTGKPSKKMFAYLEGAYHGETLGALSVGSIDSFKKIYNPLLPKTIEVPGPDCYRCYYGIDREKCTAECFNKTKEILERNHAKLAAIIVEPIVQGAAGMRIYSPEYLKKLRITCNELDIHLICDEIAVGFGKTGKMMATHHAGIIPDFVTISKAVTSGFLPLAAVLTSDKIYEAFYAPYEEQKAFMHSHTYAANPLACAAGCAVFELFKTTEILKKNVETSNYINQKISFLRNHKNVGEIRTIGMITAIELVKDKTSKKEFNWKERIGYKIYREAERNGLLLRPLGDVIYFMPPYIINKKEIDFMTETAVNAITKVLDEIE